MQKQTSKGFTARDFIVSTLIFSGVIALFVLMVGSQANTYDNQDVINPEFSAQFDKFDDNKIIGEEIWNATNQEGGLSLLGTADLIFSGTFTVISLIFQSVKLAGQTLFTFPTFFGIDQRVSIIIMTMIFSILSIWIVFSIINSLRGNKL